MLHPEITRQIYNQTDGEQPNLIARKNILRKGIGRQPALAEISQACHLPSMEWLMLHFRRLELLLRRRGSTREQAEDLIQEAFLRVKIYCDEGGEIKQPEAFLVRTVLNLARDLEAKEHRDLYVESDVETLVIAHYGPTPDEVLAAEDRLRELEGTLDAISSRTREIFFMHRLDGLSYAQIADHFDLSVSTVEKHIAKAMSALGRKLARS